MKNPDLKSERRSKFDDELDVSFWDTLWKTGRTGWDIGQPSPPIKSYIDQYDDKDAAILIPGCGNAYEAEYLIQKEFTDITLLDIAPEAVRRLEIKFEEYPQIKVKCGDFFRHEGSYDLILEQTFFCAQVLERREEYAEKIVSLLRANGRLTGVLFGINLGPSGPPFGGSEEEYRKLFEPYFRIKTLEQCYNSTPQRAGAELFINFLKR